MSVIAQFDDIPKTISNAIRSELTLLFTAMESAVQLKTRSKNAVASSLLIGSYISRIYSTGTTLRATLGTPLEYGEYVEFGTRPHWMPIEPLLRWAEHKGAHVLSMGVSFDTGRAMPTGKRKVLKGDARQRAIANLAYAVRWKIAQVGTEPRRILGEVLDSYGFRYTVVRRPDVTFYSVDVSHFLQARLDKILP